MNEWQLQHELSIRFRNEKIKIDNIEFELVCWELMFPSWSINDKNRKWNEPSIDFIFYSSSDNSFLCVELKNHIKSKKELLSAFCQTTHRAVNFAEQFTIEKIAKARKECFSTAYEERGGAMEVPDIELKPFPKTKRILLANSFPGNYEILINEWNSWRENDFHEIIKNYAINLEFKRYQLISNERLDNAGFGKLIPLKLEHIGLPFFNSI